jgi:protein-disulfide isomerase
MKRRLIVWFAAIVLLVGTVLGLYGYVSTSTLASGAAQATVVIPGVTSADIAIGDASAPVTLIEYADFQCPTCALYAPVIWALLQQYGTEIRYVYRSVPLPEHRLASAASLAANAAYRQGKFEDMALVLYGRQREWTRAGDASMVFIEYAQELLLDLDRFTADMTSKENELLLSGLYEQAVAAGLTTVPRFFLNGKEIPLSHLPPDLAVFASVIENALEQAR